MFAGLGFIVAAGSFGYFAYTFHQYIVKKQKLQLDQFAYAYYALALAFLIWAVAAFTAQPAILSASVLVGEGLILAGTLCMLDLVLPSRRWITIVAAIASGGLLYLRAHYFYPSPYLSQGILIFNIPFPVTVGLILLIGAIWLPLSARVAGQVTRAIGEPSLGHVYSSIYIAAAISAGLFTAIRRPFMAALTFAALVICFVLLIWSNLLVRMVKPHGK